jgi:hypothetical protein
MIEINTFKQLKTFDEEIYQHFDALRKAMDGEIPRGELAEMDLHTLFGGSVFIVESADDLKQVEAADGSNLHDKAGTFDICDWVLNGRFICVFLANNNNGGPSYMIPARVCELSSNVLKSVELTAEHWGGELGNNT